MVTILMMSAKLFRKKGYAILSVHEVTNKILSHDSDYNVNMVM